MKAFLISILAVVMCSTALAKEATIHCEIFTEIDMDDQPAERLKLKVDLSADYDASKTYVQKTLENAPGVEVTMTYLNSAWGPFGLRLLAKSFQPALLISLLL